MGAEVRSMTTANMIEEPTEILICQHVWAFSPPGPSGTVCGRCQVCGTWCEMPAVMVSAAKPAMPPAPRDACPRCRNSDRSLHVIGRPGTRVSAAWRSLPCRLCVGRGTVELGGEA